MHRILYRFRIFASEMCVNNKNYTSMKRKLLYILALLLMVTQGAFNQRDLLPLHPIIRL